MKALAAARTVGRTALRSLKLRGMGLDISVLLVVVVDRPDGIDATQRVVRGVGSRPDIPRYEREPETDAAPPVATRASGGGERFEDALGAAEVGGAEEVVMVEHVVDLVQRPPARVRRMDRP